MKNILYTIILSFLFSSVCLADFQAGIDADKAGDYATALKEYRVAAEQGHIKAQFNLGWLYHNGEGVTQDYKEVVKWWRLAAEQGNVRAQYNLGWLYHNWYGQGVVTQDYKEAANWFRLAAEQKDASAQNNLGLMYALGEGVIQDMVIAHMWLNIAANNGFEDAIANIDTAESKMTAEQITKAQKLAQRCINKSYRDCG
jgi:TPR repeat protein